MSYIVLGTQEDMWILNESALQQLNAGIKVEAANTDQTSKKKKKKERKWQKVMEIEKNDRGDTTSYVLTLMEKLLLRMRGSVTECKKSNSSNERCFHAGPWGKISIQTVPSEPISSSFLSSLPHLKRRKMKELMSLIAKEPFRPKIL